MDAASAALGTQEQLLVPELFQAQAQQSPEARAVGTANSALTYMQLCGRVRRLACLLIDRGAAAGTVVGVCLPRGHEAITAMLAVLTAGGAYLLLDATQPPARLRRMLASAGVRIVISSMEYLEMLSGFDIVHCDRDETPRSAQLPRLDPDDLAYVVYTSGSTGEPKAVEVTHRSLANHAYAVRDRYRLTGDDVMLQFASPAFDVIAEEVFPTLLAGGQIVPIPQAAVTSMELAAFLEHQRVTVANLPTPYWAQWVRDLDGGASTVPPALRLLVVGSEAGYRDTLERWRAHTEVPVINAYGLSETTVTATSAYFAPRDRLDTEVLPIGVPLAGCELRVLDADLAEVRPGEPGELFVGGAVLARGYLGRPDLTADRFVPDPRGGGARLYRTGDQVRMGAAGLEFLGRVDGQLKVRGHRVEPVEVEAALCGNPDVSQAHVLARRDPRRDEQLVIGYVVPLDSRRVPTAGALRAYLRERLPEHMVPQAFVVLDALPTMPNGKVDAAALPTPALRAQADDNAWVAARDETEKVLSRIWREVLEIDHLGVEDDLFALGGHSLTAVRVAGRIATEYGVSLSVKDLFAHPTIAQLARLINERATSGEPAAETQPRAGAQADGDLDAPAPLSLQQEQVWFLSQLAPDSMAYHTPTSIRVQGDLDLDVLDRVVTEISRRHEILRTTFTEADGRPCQLTHPPQPVTVPRIDLSHLPPGERERQVEELFERELRRPFDLSRLPLIRWTAIRLSATEHEIILVEHHLVHDGWSFALLMRDLKELYKAYLRGQEPALAQPQLTYRDYARWQRRALESASMQKSLAYWRDRLADAPGSLALPTDRPRASVASYTGRMLRVELPPTLPQALRQASREMRTTLFTTMYAGFAALLHRYTREQDLCIGSAFANRGSPTTHDLLGMLVNPVVLRCSVRGRDTFRELATRCGEVVLGAAAHEELPFPVLVRALNPDRDPATNPLISVMFSANDSPLPAMDLGDATVATVFERGNGGAKMDLNVVVVPRAESQLGESDRIDDRILLMWEYNADLFDEPTMHRMINAYLRLLADAVARLDAPIGQLALLGAAERHQLLTTWADGGSSTTGISPIHVAVAERAERDPWAVAVSETGRRLRYGELVDRADRLAARLQDRGVRPDEVVGVCLPRGVELVVAALGVLKAGAAYLPLDPENPPDRLAYLCQDAGARIVISAGDTASHLPDMVEVVAAIDDGAPARSPRPVPVRPDNLAYVIYTSGSTGTPKGVMVEHRALFNLVEWHLAAWRLGADDRTSLLAGPGFDASVWEIWPSLVAGASLHVPDPAIRVSPAAVQQWLLDNEITVSFAPTPLAEAMLALSWPVECPLRLLLTGGDRLHLHPQPDIPFTLVNNYGPTENTVVATAAIVPAHDATALPTVPAPAIGWPRLGVAAYVLDPELSPVLVGAVGELCLGGAGLARGYLGRPDLTAERFVPDPMNTGARLYRTGDLVRHRPDGSIEFLGRCDAQIKLRGYRIEPGEITATLLLHPAIRDAYVMTRAVPGTGEERLVAYIVAQDGVPAPGHDELHDHLASKLPRYMIPSVSMTLDALPLTRNDKVDRNALPEPAGPVAAETAMPQTQLQHRLAGIWKAVLGRDQIGVRDNFFDLGGHSLLLGQVHHLLIRDIGRDLPMVSLFQFPTIEALARHLEGTIPSAPGEALIASQTRNAKHRLSQRRALRQSVATTSLTEVEER
jgi:amino acid adenylation domain-containing protein